VDWCQKGGGGQTALHLASFASHLEAIEALLELGASINLPNGISGATALHLAGAQRKYLL
jgi:ankyrin repeat protein